MRWRRDALMMAMARGAIKMRHAFRARADMPPCCCQRMLMPSSAITLMRAADADAFTRRAVMPMLMRAAIDA